MVTSHTKLFYCCEESIIKGINIFPLDFFLSMIDQVIIIKTVFLRHPQRRASRNVSPAIAGSL
jgi:hypothetical protein